MAADSGTKAADQESTPTQLPTWVLNSAITVGLLLFSAIYWGGFGYYKSLVNADEADLRTELAVASTDYALKHGLETRDIDPDTVGFRIGEPYEGTAAQTEKGLRNQVAMVYSKEDGSTIFGTPISVPEDTRLSLVEGDNVYTIVGQNSEGNVKNYYLRSTPDGLDAEVLEGAP